MSLLNQLSLPKTYTLSIFFGNLKHDVGQYLRLFKPQTLVEGYNLARQIENIILGSSRKSFVGSAETNVYKPLFATTKLQQDVSSIVGTTPIGGFIRGGSGLRASSKSLPQVELKDRKKTGLFFCVVPSSYLDISVLSLSYTSWLLNQS